MAEHFKIVLGSPIDYEELVAYIVVNGKYIALLNQDSGPENMTIEFLDIPKEGINFALFTESLKRAKEILVGDN